MLASKGNSGVACLLACASISSRSPVGFSTKLSTTPAAHASTPCTPCVRDRQALFHTRARPCVSSSLAHVRSFSHWRSCVHVYALPPGRARWGPQQRLCLARHHTPACSLVRRSKPRSISLPARITPRSPGTLASLAALKLAGLCKEPRARRARAPRARRPRTGVGVDAREATPRRHLPADAVGADGDVRVRLPVRADELPVVLRARRALATGCCPAAPGLPARMAAPRRRRHAAPADGVAWARSRALRQDSGTPAADTVHRSRHAGRARLLGGRGGASGPAAPPRGGPHHAVQRLAGQDEQVVGDRGAAVGLQHHGQVPPHRVRRPPVPARARRRPRGPGAVCACAGRAPPAARLRITGASGARSLEPFHRQRDLTIPGSRRSAGRTGAPFGACCVGYRHAPPGQGFGPSACPSGPARASRLPVPRAPAPPRASPPATPPSQARPVGLGRRRTRTRTAASGGRRARPRSPCARARPAPRAGTRWSGAC
jgi:hypothetical protein